MDDVVKGDDVGVLQVAQQRHCTHDTLNAQHRAATRTNYSSILCVDRQTLS